MSYSQRPVYTNLNSSLYATSSADKHQQLASFSWSAPSTEQTRNRTSESWSVLPRSFSSPTASYKITTPAGCIDPRAIYSSPVATGPSALYSDSAESTGDAENKTEGPAPPKNNEPSTKDAPRTRRKRARYDPERGDGSDAYDSDGDDDEYKPSRSSSKRARIAPTENAASHLTRSGRRKSSSTQPTSAKNAGMRKKAGAPKKRLKNKGPPPSSDVWNAIYEKYVLKCDPSLLPKAPYSPTTYVPQRCCDSKNILKNHYEFRRHYLSESHIERRDGFYPICCRSCGTSSCREDVLRRHLRESSSCASASAPHPEILKWYKAWNPCDAISED